MRSALCRSSSSSSSRPLHLRRALLRRACASSGSRYSTNNDNTYAINQHDSSHSAPLSPPSASNARALPPDLARAAFQRSRDRHEQQTHHQSDSSSNNNNKRKNSNHNHKQSWFNFRLWNGALTGEQIALAIVGGLFFGTALRLNTAKTIREEREAVFHQELRERVHALNQLAESMENEHEKDQRVNSGEDSVGSVDAARCRILANEWESRHNELEGVLESLEEERRGKSYLKDAFLQLRNSVMMGAPSSNRAQADLEGEEQGEGEADGTSAPAAAASTQSDSDTT